MDREEAIPKLQNEAAKHVAAIKAINHKLTELEWESLTKEERESMANANMWPFNEWMEGVYYLYVLDNGRLSPLGHAHSQYDSICYQGRIERRYGVKVFYTQYYGLHGNGMAMSKAVWDKYPVEELEWRS